MIPVMGLPILNQTYLLTKMLDSVDHDIDRLYIIDNGGIIQPEMVRGYRANNVHIADPGFNMGVGPAWNLIIRANIQAPYWLITCNDIVFSPGCLARLAEDMDAHAGIPHLSRIIMDNERHWGNHFGAFAINAEAIDSVGWFDENIYPIYYEDTDWLWRASKVDGFTLTDIDSNTHHDGNASWKGIPYNAAGNKRTWDINRDHFDAKSGFGSYDLPFDVDTPDGIRYTLQPRVSVLREQDWKVDRKDNVKNDGHFA